MIEFLVGIALPMVKKMGGSLFAWHKEKQLYKMQADIKHDERVANTEVAKEASFQAAINRKLTDDTLPWWANVILSFWRPFLTLIAFMVAREFALEGNPYADEVLSLAKLSFGYWFGERSMSKK